MRLISSRFTVKYSAVCTGDATIDVTSKKHKLLVVFQVCRTTVWCMYDVSLKLCGPRRTGNQWTPAMFEAMVQDAKAALAKAAQRHADAETAACRCGDSDKR